MATDATMPSNLSTYMAPMPCPVSMAVTRGRTRENARIAKKLSLAVAKPSSLA